MVLMPAPSAPLIKQKPRKREDEREWLVCVDGFLKRWCYSGTGVACKAESNQKRSGTKSFQDPTKEKQLLVELLLCPTMKVAREQSFSFSLGITDTLTFRRKNLRPCNNDVQPGLPSDTKGTSH
uniref:Uncharacterized protein n=1 Tax=Molossus molossus TaxID=27622 RepID=A0A7J8ER96_MOLMO|nr:hypothetical protein HJG59_008729 [Molossus molossus]